MIRLLHDWRPSEIEPCGMRTMDEHTRMTRHDDTPSAAELEEEILISRLIDGEAKTDDEQSFEQRAEVQPALWRRLALRQRDMLLLAAQVEKRTACADTIELHGLPIFPRRLTWTLSVSGWAAMLILAVTWAVTSGGWRDEGVEEIKQGDMPTFINPHQEVLSQQALLEQYERAEWVQGELQATLMQWQRLEDGSVELSYLRRLQERIILSPELAAEVMKKVEAMNEQGEQVLFHSEYLDDLRMQQFERDGGRIEEDAGSS